MNKKSSALRLFSVLASLLCAAALPGGLLGADDSSSLDVGNPAPDFSAIDQDGHLWKLSDYLGKKNVVVYFYPAAMTGGCTKQACAFRDDQSKLKELDAVVVGVSGDVPAGLKVFQKSHDLNFTLLADYNGNIAKMFGVPTRAGGSIERTFDGANVTLERGITTSRWTFVIGKDGTIGFKNTNVNAAADSESVQAFLKSKG